MKPQKDPPRLSEVWMALAAFPWLIPLAIVLAIAIIVVIFF